jgi:hypothetical protein
MAQVQTARRRKVIAAPPTQTVDFGPDIRRRDVDVPARVRIVDGDIIVLEPAYTREADTVVTRRADPERPDRQQDIEVAIRWLPHRMHQQGQMSKEALAAASWYRDLMDKSAGVTDRTPGHYGATDQAQKSIEMGTVDYMVQASIAMQNADRAMGVNNVTLMRMAVTASSKSEIALALGIAPARVSTVCSKVFDLLDEWRARYGVAR